MGYTKAQKEVIELKKKIETLEKDLEYETRQKESAREDRDEAQKELEQVQLMIDEFPNAPSRTRKTKGVYSVVTVELSPAARLASWFALGIIKPVQNINRDPEPEE